MKLKFFLVSILALLSLVAYQKYSEYSALKSIDSYKACMHDDGSKIIDTPSRICVTKIGIQFPQLYPSPSPYIISTESWKTYSNRNWQISFKYPDGWRVVESSQVIKIYPTGYSDGTFFTLTQTHNSFSNILNTESTKLACRLDGGPINHSFGEDKNVNIDSAFNHCDKTIGFYYLYGKTSNMLIQHGFDDSGAGNSVGAVLSTFKFTD